MAQPPDGYTVNRAPPKGPPDPSMGPETSIVTPPASSSSKNAFVKVSNGSFIPTGNSGASAMGKSTSKVTFNGHTTTTMAEKGSAAMSSNGDTAKDNEVVGDDSKERRVGFKVKFKFTGSNQVNVAEKHKAFITRFLTAAPGATFAPSTEEIAIQRALYPSGEERQR